MRRHVTRCIAVVTMLFTGGCMVRNQYIVRDPSPGSVVTVIPETMNDDDVSAANHVMEVLIACGANVIERPVMLKERSDFSSSGSGTGVGVTGSGQIAVVSGQSGKTGEVKTSLDPVALISDTKADYVFIVQYLDGHPRFRLVKKATGQVLRVGSFRDEINPVCCLTWFSYETENDQAKKLLYSVGILN